VAADTAMAGKDLMADLLTELDIGRPTPPAPSAGGHDLLDDIFGTPQQPVKEAGDSLSELLGDLGASEKTAERAADQDIFQAFVSSLPQESRVSGSAQTHFDLGIAFREMDSCDEAIAEFEKALTKDDGALAFSINYELGQCYAGLGKYEMASEYLDSALTEGVDDEQTMLDLTFELAATLKKLGRLERAKKLFMEVDQRSSNYRGAKAEIAECDRQGAKKGDGDDNIGYL
jgi:tetratricopeptide (TPR) repeat protein